MKIVGIPVGTPTPRADWAQTDPKKADFIKNKPDAEIQAAQKAAEDAATAASNAQTAADTAQTAADNANTAAVNAQTAADNAQTRADEAMTAAGNAEKNAKDYSDTKYLFTVVQVPASGWTGDVAPYTQRIAVEGVLVPDSPHSSVVYSDDLETKMAQKEAFALVDDLDTEDGFVTFTCFEEKPVTDIAVQLEVNR